MTPDGLLVITGRTTEVINRGGDKLAPDVIEEVIRMAPAIIDTAVFAVPGTQQIWAAVVSKGRSRRKPSWHSAASGWPAWPRTG